MFRHQGKRRTLKHNVQIASVLSFVAGTVNAAGFLAIKQLTTNVTGHFALFINDLADFQFWKGTIYFLYIFSFLFGSFTSSFFIETFRKSKKLNVFVIPTVIEAFVLIFIALISDFSVVSNANVIACFLLFAMGIQNSFVTKISDAIVRTTHLTGLFTDLGIDLSHLFFPKMYPNRQHIKANIQLRIYIICFFFFGGLVGGFIYSRMGFGLNTLIVSAFILLASLFYDDFRVRVVLSSKRSLHKKKLFSKSS